MCCLMRTSRGLFVSPIQHLPQSQGILIHILYLLRVSVLSGHQYSAECSFGFKNSPDIVAVPNPSVFLRYSPSTGDNYCAMKYCVRMRTVVSP